MPYKHRKKRTACSKQWRKQNEAAARRNSQEYYESNKRRICSKKNFHYASDKTFRYDVQKSAKKYHASNKDRIQVSRKKCISDDVYRENYREKDRLRTTLRLKTDTNYCLKNKNRARINTARRLLLDFEYYQKNLLRSRANTVKRLKENVTYKDQNRMRATINKKKRMLDDAYAADQRKRELLRYQTDTCYAAKKTLAAKQRKQTVTLTSNQRKRCQVAARKKTPHQNSVTKQQVKCKASKQQTYWLRRHRLLSSLSNRQRMLGLQQKMHQKSGVPILDIKMLFAKAQQNVNKAHAKINKFHTNLKLKAKDYLDGVPVSSEVSEEQINSMFSRVHSCSSEPYFWDTGYNMLSASTETVPVDEHGIAYVFKPVHVKWNDLQNSSTLKTWECNPHICKVSQDDLRGLIVLFDSIHRAANCNLTTFYLQIDNCEHKMSSVKSGHYSQCVFECSCASLLLSARSLSCHFTELRSFLRRIYEVRYFCLYLVAVKTAMTEGNYEQLLEAAKLLNEAMNRLAVNGKKNECDEQNRNTCLVSEEEIMQEFGAELRKVENLRDNYSTDSCAICEQLRRDLVSLKSLDNRKGFDSKKMEQVVDLLYQHTTQFEAIDDFFENTYVCRYCSDKLLSNKDIARSMFNSLAITATPQCIQDLNLFERSLIKLTMTCLTVVRLGQISNKHRPNKELTSALKGRIAYLPVDVSANAKFVPDTLLNTDSLVVLVSGQPTKKNVVWTSIVDLHKVHKALMWLKENNHLYKDLPAYTTDELHSIIQEKIHRQHTAIANDTGNSTALLRKLDQAAKTHLYENFSVQPLSSDYPSDVFADYQMAKITGPSENVFDSDLDLRAYPELFPTGQFGMRDVTRTVKITNSDYIKSRLLNKNPKFRLHIDYIFHLFYLQEICAMNHSVGHMLRTVTGNQLSARALHERLQNRDGELQTKLFSMMANLRGSRQYFSKLAMDVKWLINDLGPPTLFITVSTAEYFNDALIAYLRNINSSVKNINSMTPAELCAMDPVSVSIHFQQKWNAIFKHLIKSDKNPIFGKVQDHFWRLEYQARGAPHVHCVLWIKDAPILGNSSIADVKSYIEKVVTCAKPDKNISPRLEALTSKFQTHKCNKYCTKTYKKSGKFFKKCRFGFPRPVKTSTELNDVIDCLAVMKNNQPRKRLYHLARDKDEQFVNDYNPALLLANEANVDVQYIGHLGSRLPYYITDYMAKHERSEQDEMWADIFSSSKTLGTNAMAFMLKSIKNRQVGINEAVDRLLGHKLYSMSRQLRFADLQPKEKAKRIIKSAQELEKLLQNNPESEDVYQLHWVLDVYPDRPDELENCSLHEVLSWYERETQNGQNNNRLQLKSINMYLRKRQKQPYIVTHQKINPNQSDENKEIYYYYLLKLFKPWRSEKDICLAGITYFQTFEIMKEKLPEMLTYHEKNMKMNQQEAETEQAIRDRAEQLQTQAADTEDLTVDDPAGAFDGCAADHLQAAMQDITDAHVRTLMGNGAEDVDELYRNLNPDQKRITNLVINGVTNSQNPVRLVVSGTAGTGKSRVISVIDKLITKKFSTNSSIPVVVAAPTGLSAFNVQGVTIHKLLSLPVEHGKPADYSALNVDQLTIVRATLRGLRLLIIDEVSMVSSLTLMYIHLRLTEIMCNNDLFGGISVVMFADLLQLPPVKGNQPFLPVTFLEAKQRLGSIASMNLWTTFSYDELTINMRQQNDKQYANLLSSIRTGHVTDEACCILSSRLINPDRRATVEEIINCYETLVSDGLSPLILMPTIAQISEVNKAMLQQIGNDIQKLDAIDTLDTMVDRHLLSKVHAAYKKLDEDVTRTAGLEKSLHLCIGARVMLKRNRNIEAGLVNGSIGTITGFKMCDTRNGMQISSVLVNFDKQEQIVQIDRDSHSFEVLKSIYYTRRQFPLMLAFAITVHKSQGLSLTSAIVDAGSKCFGTGMTYVALSRVTKLDGLHLIEFNRKKVACDKKALSEYDRLREKYTPHLGNLRGCGGNVNKEIGPPVKRMFNQVEGMKTTNPSKKRKTDDSESPHCTTDGLQSNEYASATVCSVTSLMNNDQMLCCSKFNLSYSTNELQRTPLTDTASSKKLQAELIHISQRPINVTTYLVRGDGNCLFRSLALGITGSQDQHDIIRSLVVGHMLNPDVQVHMQQLFTSSGNDPEEYKKHILDMQENGCWGTEQEIIAAANLFDICIISYSLVTRNHYSLQYFTPHFAACQTCNYTCSHRSLYLTNSSGSHYNLTVVRTDSNAEE